MSQHEPIQLWSLSLDALAPDLHRFDSILSADERARSDRFHFRRDRERFIVCRGALRIILGRSLGIEPEAVRFQYGPNGKPGLAHDTSLRFNVSHSREAALIAVARGTEIGVDIERIRHEADFEMMAGRFFSRREAAAQRALPESQSVNAFFKCWTRKEAYLKARGDGLSFPLDGFDVSVGGEAALLENRVDPDEVGRWSLRDVSDEAAGYAAALAVEGADWEVARWQFST
ncbi:MAG: 4'-phosphopantetheinyl transferase superfamily protein [Chloroflexota bacterium]